MPAPECHRGRRGNNLLGLWRDNNILKQSKMRSTFFEVKLSHLTVTEKGQDKVAKETIIVNEEALTSAINKAETWAADNNLRDIRSLGGKLASIKEVYVGEGEKIFKATVDWVLEINEKGVKKIDRYPMLVQAETIDEAKKIVEELNRQVASDWTISELRESRITRVVLG